MRTASFGFSPPLGAPATAPRRCVAPQSDQPSNDDGWIDAALCAGDPVLLIAAIEQCVTATPGAYRYRGCGYLVASG